MNLSRIPDAVYHQAIDTVRLTTESYGMKFQIRPVQYLRLPGLRCSGYFDEAHDQGALVVAGGKNRHDVLAVMYHEFAHAYQCHTQRPQWTRYRTIRGHESGVTWGSWLDGNIKLDSFELALVVADTQDCEIDACRLAWKFMERDGIDKYYNPKIVKGFDNLYIYSFRLLYDIGPHFKSFVFPWSDKKKLQVLKECQIPSYHRKSYYRIPAKTKAAMCRIFYPHITKK